MDLDAIKYLLEQAFSDADIRLASEGSHLHLTIVSDQFTGLSSVKKQQKVYAVLNEKIASGEVHAVHMTLLTPAERSSNG
ncbi:MAG: BolA/IbaG family iron-sulfur metabolism protein [Cellvibrionaceae bacterium]|nr:BolA/IbaG family iron-sulfur metabolism protein [Cellvibrionaceae bacterium]